MESTRIKTHQLIRHLFRKELRTCTSPIYDEPEACEVTPTRDITHEEMRTWLSTPVPHHFLDSGDYYGRQYQINALKDFKRIPPVHYEFDYTREDRAITTGDMLYTVELYHFLMETCGFDAVTDTVNAHMEASPDDEGLYYAQRNGGFYTYNLGDAVLGNMSGDFMCVASTLSGEELFETDDRVYASITIHGGCDPRGGFQDEKLVALKVPYSSFVSAEVAMWWAEWDDTGDGYRNEASTAYDGCTLRDENGDYITIIEYMEYMDTPATVVEHEGEISDDADCASGRFGGYVPVMPEKLLPTLSLYISE